MPFTDCDNLRVHYELAGGANSPVLLFSNSLGTNLSMWNSQLPSAEKKFRVLRYDSRGHGLTTVTPGPYSIELLARDVLRLLDNLKIQRAHFCGLSKGGMIGMWLGVNAPDRLHKLILCNTAAKIGTPESWNAPDQIRPRKWNAVVRTRRNRTLVYARIPPPFPRNRRTNAANDRKFSSTKATSPAAKQFATWTSAKQVSQIRVPTLVISGTKDPVIPLAESHFLGDQISGAAFRRSRSGSSFEYRSIGTIHRGNHPLSLGLI